MPGRNYVSSLNYRYGYQGQFSEKDPETELNSFELRNYNSKLMRWNSTDFYKQYHSPYMAMGNNPVSRVDSDGGVDDVYYNSQTENATIVKTSDNFDRLFYDGEFLGYSSQGIGSMTFSNANFISLGAQAQSRGELSTARSINDGIGLSSGLVEYSAISAAKYSFKYGYRGMQATEAAGIKTLTKVFTGARYVGLGGAAVGTGLSIYQGYNNGFSNQDIVRIGVQSTITGIGFIGPIGFGVGVGLGILEAKYGNYLYNNFSTQSRLQP